MASTTDPWQRRLAIFERSYDEVLAALKHQDDKVNRVLMTLSFLTVAGVNLYINLAPTPARFAGSSWSVSFFFFVLFMFSVAFSAALAMAAIGPSRVAPRLYRPKRSAREVGPENRNPNLIFYYLILRDEKKWGRYLHLPPARLERILAQNLHGDALILARRVNYKMARSREAGAFLELAVLALTLLAVFGLRHGASDSHSEAVAFAASIDHGVRWKLGASLIAISLLRPFWDFGYMRRLGLMETARGTENGTYASYAAMLIPVSLGIALLFLAPRWHANWLGLCFGIGLVLLTRYCFVGGETFLRLLLSLAVLAAAVVLGYAYANRPHSCSHPGHRSLEPKGHAVASKQALPRRIRCRS